MKKKFLSLMMAAAVVATTSVSAFADVTKTNTGDIDHEISIEGNVKSDSDEVLPSTISVSVPTNANFTVGKDGKLISGSMNVVNEGGASVDVYAYKFNDPTGERKINIKKTIGETDEKGTITLALKGGNEYIYFGSDVSRGIYESFTANTPVSNDGKIIKTLAQGEKVSLEFDGEGSKRGNLTSPLQENFTLTLKIKATPKANPVVSSGVSQGVSPEA